MIDNNRKVDTIIRVKSYLLFLVNNKILSCLIQLVPVVQLEQEPEEPGSVIKFDLLSNNIGSKIYLTK